MDEQLDQLPVHSFDLFMRNEREVLGREEHVSGSYLIVLDGPRVNASKAHVTMHTQRNLGGFLRNLGGKDIVSNESVELNKKRKLQYDLELPLSKHKFRDRSRGSDHAAAEETDDMQKWNKQIVARELGCDSEELGESYNDSNSVSEGYETTMTLDLDDEADKSSGKTASPSVSSRNLKMEGDFDPFSIQNVNESINTEQDLEDYDAYIKNSLENLDGGIDDSVLYSNDVAPHAFLLSSERWINGQGAQSSAKKPTIDKEFEQYFSMLML